jgi:hypothetical protein
VFNFYSFKLNLYWSKVCQECKFQTIDDAHRLNIQVKGPWSFCQIFLGIANNFLLGLTFWFFIWNFYLKGFGKSCNEGSIFSQLTPTPPLWCLCFRMFWVKRISSIIWIKNCIQSFQDISRGEERCLHERVSKVWRIRLWNVLEISSSRHAENWHWLSWSKRQLKLLFVNNNKKKITSHI